MNFQSCNVETPCIAVQILDWKRFSTDKLQESGGCLAIFKQYDKILKIQYDKC